MSPRGNAAATAYDWPGNVNELKNVVDRCELSGGASGRAGDLPTKLAARRSHILTAHQLATEPRATRYDSWHVIIGDVSIHTAHTAARRRDILVLFRNLGDDRFSCQQERGD